MRHTVTHARRLLYAIPVLVMLALLTPAPPAHSTGPPPLLKVRIPYGHRPALARLGGPAWIRVVGLMNGKLEDVQESWQAGGERGIIRHGDSCYWAESVCEQPTTSQHILPLALPPHKAERALILYRDVERRRGTACSVLTALLTIQTC